MSDIISISSDIYNTNNNTMNYINNNDTIYKSIGWFFKNKSLIKYMYNGYSRCFECYNFVIYEDIAYSRIINNKIRLNDSIKLEQLSTFEKYYKVICICKSCIEGCNNNPKLAPKNYGDIITDLLINDKLDIIAEDIKKINDNKLNKLQDKIDHLLFNYNEKHIIYNHLINENNKLKNNLDMEVEKFRILNEHKSKNKELHETIKNNLLQASTILFQEHKKIIDDQISKYNDLNCAIKYNIPECKICLMREVRVAIQCGHLLCNECFKQISNDSKKLLNTETFDIDNLNNMENMDKNIINCPFCKTISQMHIPIYL